MTQPTLFDHSGNAVSLATKREAFIEHKTSGKLCAQSLRVLECVRNAGECGMTRHEIADELKIPLSSVCGRVNELLGSKLQQRAGQRRDGRAVLFLIE